MRVFIAEGQRICIDPHPDAHKGQYPRLPIGTVVHLRSGSPLMVIVDYDTTYGNYVCSWRNPGPGADYLATREESFSSNVLTVVRLGGFRYPQKRLPKP